MPNPIAGSLDYELLTKLQILADRLQRAPTQRELKEHGMNYSTFRNRFGSYERALLLIGCRPNPTGFRRASDRPSGRKPKYSKKKLIRSLLKVSQTLGYVPPQKELRKHGLPPAQTFANHFGSFNAAILEAGLIARRRPSEFEHTNEELIQYIKDIGAELGRKPTFSEVKRMAPVTIGTFVKRFGSFHDTLLLAGYVMRRKREERHAETVA